MQKQKNSLYFDYKTLNIINLSFQNYPVMKKMYVFLLPAMIFTLAVMNSCKKENDDDNIIAMKKMIDLPEVGFMLNSYSVKDDGGFLVTGGYTDSYNFLAPSALYNLNSDGKINWIAKFNIDTFDYSMCTSAIEDGNGGFFVAGICGNWYWGQRGRYWASLDNKGTFVSFHIYDIPEGYLGWNSKLFLRKDGKLLMLSDFFPREDYSLPAKLEADVLDAQGNRLQQHIYDHFSTSVNEKAVLLDNEELLISGTIDPGTIDGSPDFKVMKLDRDGNEIFDKEFGITSKYEHGDYCTNDDGGYVFSGTTFPYGICTVYRLNQSGEPSEPVYLNERSINSNSNRIFPVQQGYLLMSYGDDFNFCMLNKDLSVKSTSTVVYRHPIDYSYSYVGPVIPYGNSQFVMLYQSDAHLIIIKTKAL
jgi:hypothetical protein